MQVGASHKQSQLPFIPQRPNPFLQVGNHLKNASSPDKVEESPPEKQLSQQREEVQSNVEMRIDETIDIISSFSDTSKLSKKRTYQQTGFNNAVNQRILKKTK